MGSSGEPLHIDIPVELTDVKVVFSIGALAFEGDLPASIFHLQLIGNDIADWNAQSEIIAVFHTNAGHVTLNDSLQRRPEHSNRQPLRGSNRRSDQTWRPNRAVRRDRQGTRVGQCQPASWHPGQHRCHGEDD